MNCNCNNNGNTALRQPIITHVQGNVLRVAIPLTLRTVELVDVDVDGETQQQAVATDTDFYPSDKQPVRVVFSKGATSMPITATMNGNVAYVEERGKIPVGTYEMTVTCADDNGNNYRFNQNAVLKVVHSTAEAGITTPIEYEVKTWYLDAAIFLAMKGEDGVGIEDITTESSGEIGGFNTVTITMTDGRTRTFTVMNGSGSVDEELDPNSRHPISNAAVTGKFRQVEAELENVFGDVGYNVRSATINFYAKGKPKIDENILATLDARPFVKDGMVNNVYISNNTLVITFNTDSGKMPIGVPLSSIFNPNNYYTRTQITNLLDGYYTKERVIGLLEDKASINGSSSQDFSTLALFLCMEREPMVLVKSTVDHGTEDVTLDFTDMYNNGAKLSYTFGTGDAGTKHIATEEYVEEYVNEHSWYSVSVVNHKLVFSGLQQPQVVNHKLIL